MTKTYYQEANMTSIICPHHFISPHHRPKSNVITPPAAISHHYIKRSSQLYSPQLFLPRPHSPISSTSTSRRPTSSSTITPLYPHPEPTHKYPNPLDASTADHLNFPPSVAHLSPTQPITRLSPSASLPKSQTAPSQSTDLSHQPILPMIKKSNFHHSVPNLPPTYTLNLPSPPIHLDQAMETEVVDRLGRSVKFANLIDLDFKTVVIFIRHFRCGYSQRYIRRLSQIANGEMQDNQQNIQKTEQEKIKFKRTPSKSNLDGQPTDELENWIGANGVKVIVIGHGNYQLIESYRKILNCPFPIYTDLSKDQVVYKLLGMNKIKDLKLKRSGVDSRQDPLLVSLNLQTLKKSKSHNPRGGTAVNTLFQRHNEPLMDNGESKLAFLSQVIYNAWRMPWKWSGDPQQLGGEIVFEPIREDRRIKRKPIKQKFFHDLPTKSNSVASNSSWATSGTTADESDGSSRLVPFRRPSCSIKSGGRSNNSGFRKNLQLMKESAKEIQVQCKFIHQMTSFTDHFSIDELMMQSGIRLTSLMNKY